MAKKTAKKAQKTAKEKIDKPIPPKPKSNPTLGDLTPAVLAWRKEFEPELYKLRFEAYVKKNKVELPEVD
jgi:hypothetical protein